MRYDPELKRKIQEKAELCCSLDKDDPRMPNAEDEVIRATERYVMSFYTKKSAVFFDHDSEIREDILQDIRIGILHAIRSYDPKSTPFTSWVVYFTRSAVSRDTSLSWIRLPSYIKERITTVRKLSDAGLSDEEICSKLGITQIVLDRIRYSIKLQGALLPLHEVSDSGVLTTHDDGYLDKRYMESVVDELPEKYSRIIKLVYDYGYSASEISSMLGMAQSKVSYYKKQALDLLRKKMSAHNNDTDVVNGYN